MLLFVGIFVITSVIANSDAIAIKTNAEPDPKADAETATKDVETVAKDVETVTKDPGAIVFPADNAASEQTASDPLTVKVDCQAIHAKAVAEKVVAHDDTNMYVNSTENVSDKPAGENLEQPQKPNYAEVGADPANEKSPTEVQEEDKEAEKEEDEEQEQEEEKRVGGEDKNGESEDTADKI